MRAMFVVHTRTAFQSPKSDLKKPIVGHVEPVTSPSEAFALKDQIRKMNPAKFYTFSLAHMRKVAVPPVAIPKPYRSRLARSMLVGGHRVPFTQAMWKISKRRLIKLKLDCIHEHVVYN